MPNRWVDFIKNYASLNDLSYGCAITKPEAREAYRAKYGNRRNLPQYKERENMGMNDYDAPPKPTPPVVASKKGRGRPRKYSDVQASKQANREKTLASYHRRKQT